jgi:hypothetical protein
MAGFLPDSLMESIKKGNFLSSLAYPIRRSIQKGIKVAQTRIIGRLDYFFNWCMIREIKQVTLYVSQKGNKNLPAYYEKFNLPGWAPLDDDYVEYDNCGQRTAIHRMAVAQHDLDKVDRTNIDIALSWLKYEKCSVIDLYIKHGDMDDHYYEFDRNGIKRRVSERLQAATKVKQLT